MPLTLILGPANSAKAGEVLGAYAAESRRDAVLVVPTAVDAAHYDRELAAGGVLLGRALTFPALLAEIARRAGAQPDRLTGLQRERLLRRLVASLELPALGPAARSNGFPAAAGRLIAELRSHRVAPGRFAAALRAWAGDDPDRAGYAADLARLVSRYDAALERSGRADAERFAWTALDALRAAPDRWGSTPVFLYGFDDLTAIERDAVETLSGFAGARVTVSLTYEPGRSALAARGGVVEALRQSAQAVRELPSLDAHYAPPARAALHHLERSLFEPDPRRLDPGAAVVLLEAGGERAEAELVAAEVLAALRDGVPAAEIVVVCRSLGRSGARFERALAAYGVPVASERPVALAHTALGRGLLALVRCALGADRTGAEELLAYLRTPGVAGPAAAIDALELALRQAGGADLAGARAAADAERLPTPEIDALRAAAADGSVGPALAAQVRRLLAAPHRGSGAPLDAEAALDARAAAVVLDALSELAELEPVWADDALQLLFGLMIPPEPAGSEAAVRIADPLAIRARRFRRVFVTGLCEGEFPAPGSGDPFLGEDRRRELALASGLALPPEEDALARERYLFYACVSRATERLVLSYRSADEDGNLVLASPFLADVAELFVVGWPERRRRRLLADVVWPEALAPTERERELAIAAAGAKAVGVGGRDGFAPAGPAELRTLGESALRHVRHREVVSGGALESFADCPVKWLVESQLQPEALEPDAEPLARGNFMHDVLERVIGGLRGPLTPASLPAAESALDELTAIPSPALAAGRPPAVRAAILRGIEADLRRYLRHEAADGCAWIPRAVELRFGFEDPAAAEAAAGVEGPAAGEVALAGIELGEGAERVRLRGVIDRVDVEPGGGRRAIVRDYKSGAARPERAGARWSEGHQFQVALYMIAVRRLLALEPVAGFYQPLTGNELRARGAFAAGTDVGRRAYPNDRFEPDELAELLETIEREAVAVAATLRRGELTPRPETCSRDGCRHPGICWAVR